MLTYVGCFEHLKYLSKYLTIIFYKNFSNSVHWNTNICKDTRIPKVIVFFRYKLIDKMKTIVDSRSVKIGEKSGGIKKGFINDTASTCSV